MAYLLSMVPCSVVAALRVPMDSMTVPSMMATDCKSPNTP